jgi:hypothetical protein
MGAAHRILMSYQDTPLRMLGADSLDEALDITPGQARGLNPQGLRQGRSGLPRPLEFAHVNGGEARVLQHSCQCPGAALPRLCQRGVAVGTARLFPMPHEEHDLLGLGQTRGCEEAEGQGDNEADRRTSHGSQVLS